MTFSAEASQSENLFQARLIKMSRAPHLFEGFSPLDRQTSRVRFAGVTGGEGPPLLLLHGYPESHATWHDVAPALAKRYTVVAPDLPGYGKSRVLDAGPWDKRAVGAELVAMMRSFGHDRFAVVGHDRGARVGYRLALDHPDRVSAYCSLAVVPTLDVWPAVDRQFAKGAFHWFLFLQPGDLPERMLAADPDAFLEATLNQMAGGIEKLHPAAVADYREAFREKSVRQAMIEDYRSAYDTDLDHDAADRAAGRKIACPVMVLWADERLVASGMETGVLTAADVWRRWAGDVSGFDIACGHLLPEQAPEAVIEKIAPFLEASLKRDTA
ncbi:alpha/beta fold hydrolase [Bradyrhizobium diversitatis]|nr:alpha/beta hydrolase [Bradyrhizobium diversitatis]